MLKSILNTLKQSVLFLLNILSTLAKIIAYT